ncbi:MAG TPA: hypothetical protein VLA72_04115 [Anaerolineales bacterium]|jgi:hypothetical protein|nr:hypothetical protein [Anaerolineales bacterium]
MFDNLRDISEDPLYEDEQNNLYQEIESDATSSVAAPAPARKKIRKKNRNFLGMTAQQRFLVAVMFMIATCLIGTLAMFVTGKMSIF